MGTKCSLHAGFPERWLSGPVHNTDVDGQSGKALPETFHTDCGSALRFALTEDFQSERSYLQIILILR